MPKRCIAIEYSGDECRAVQLRNSKNKPCVEKAVRIAAEKFSSLGDELLKAGFNLALPAVFTTSWQNSHFANLVDGTDAILPGDETDSHCPPVHIDTAIRIHLPGEHKLPGSLPTSLTVTSDKSELETIIKLANENKIKCQRIELVIFALLAAIDPKDKPTGQYMLVHNSNHRLTIFAYDNDCLMLVRNMPLGGIVGDTNNIILREIQLTWRSAFGTPIHNDDRIILAGDIIGGTLISELKKEIQCQVKVSDITERFDISGQVDNAGLFFIAAGAGWLYLNPCNRPDLNLLKSVGQSSKDSESRANPAITVVLILLFAIMATVHVADKNAALHKRHNDLQSDIDRIFSETMPELQGKVVSYDAKRKNAIMEEVFKANEQLTGQYAILTTPKTDIIALMAKLAGKLPTGTKYSSISIDGENVGLTAYSHDGQSLIQLSESLNSDEDFKLILSEPDEQNKLSVNIQLEIVKRK